MRKKKISAKTCCSYASILVLMRRGKTLPAFASFPENTNTAKIKTENNNRATHYPPLPERERDPSCTSLLALTLTPGLCCF